MPTGSGSVRVRVLGGFIAAGLLPLIGALIVIEVFSNRSLQDAEFRRIRELGGEAVRQITVVMERASSDLDSVASNPILVDPNRSTEAKLAEMRRLVYVSEHFHELTLHSKTGFVLASTTANHTGQRDRSRWFRDAVKSRRKSITSPYKVLGENGLFVTVYTPFHQQDEIEQVITSRIRFEEISNLVSDIKVGSAGELVLIDEFGNLLAGRDQEKVLTRFDSARPVTNWLNPTHGYYTFRGRPCLYTAHAMGPKQTRVDRPWTLLCFAPVDEVDAILTNSRVGQILAGLGGLLVACAIGLFTNRHLVRPLESLLATSRAIKLGDPDARMPEKGPTEIAKLAESLNEVLADLRGKCAALEAKVTSRTHRIIKAQNSLRKERASLAERVEMRTCELRAANKELARTAQMKDEFMVGMSRELRAPLNAILTNTGSLEKGTYGDLSNRQLNRLKIIDESGRHLLSMINDMIDVARIESGDMQLATTEIDIAQLAESCLSPVRDAAAKKDIVLRAEVDPTATTILADERRLKQILVILLSHAVRLTSAGRVDLRITTNAEDQTIDFTVQDTGAGISPDQIGRLFQPFVHCESSLERQYESTGLGLALVYSFAEIHGGRVSADSKPESGTCITVTLPWRASQNDPAESPSGPLRARTICLGKVLLADDNESERVHLAKNLNRAGYEVHLAPDGASAVEMAPLVEPDIILLDVQMPGMDGIETTHLLRGEPDLRDIPIVGLTALDTPGDIRRIHEAGMSDCILKPASMIKLISILDFHIDKVHRRADCAETNAA